jgi:nitroreductase
MSLQQLLTRRFGSGAPESKLDTAPPTVEAMLRHRSCRDFRPEPVDPSIVQTLLAAALSSPSKSDLQQTTILWIKDSEVRVALEGLLSGSEYAWLAGAAEMLVFCGDNRRIRLAAARRGRPFPNDTLDQFMNAAVDAAIVLGAAVTAAEAFGLGTCPLSELRDRAGDLISLLELPNGVFPLAGLALGWPATAGRVSLRLPYAVSVQGSTYSDAPFESNADTYEAERDARERRPDAQQRETERFGIVRPYGWAEDRTRQYAVPRRADWSEHVRAQGFDLG